MNSRETILVLDGQTNQALACVRSLGKAGHRVLIASCRHAPLAAWSRHCACRVRIQGETRAAFTSLRAWAVEHGVGVVLPLTERSCLLLNAEREEWEAAGVTVGCDLASALEKSFDKARTLRLAAECGVRFPRTVFPASAAEYHEAAEAVGFPCVVKPRRSNAWDGERFLPDRGCGYAGSHDELASLIESRRQGDGGWPLIQAYVEGQGKGAFALCERGRVVAWFAHERLRDVNPTGSGSSLRRAVTLPERIRAPAERLLAAMRWHGPAMVEFRDDGRGEPYLMEVNGRFWNSLQLAVDAGVDFPRLWVEVLRGGWAEQETTPAADVTLRWLWGDVKRLLYIMRGPVGGRVDNRYPTRSEGLRELFGRQPRGTRLEIWRADDLLPAVGEWVQGLGELLSLGERVKRWQGFWRTHTLTGHTTARSPSKSGGEKRARVA